MKVLCLNNKCIPGRVNNELDKITEGHVYTLDRITQHGGYVLQGTSCSGNGYAPERFVMLSDKDEKELVNERELINS